MKDEYKAKLFELVNTYEYDTIKKFLLEVKQHKLLDVILDLKVKGRSALMLASINGNSSFVKAVLEASKLVEKIVLDKATDGTETNSLHYASSFGRFEVVKLFLNYIPERDREKYRENLIFSKDQMNRTPLHEALDSDHYNINITKLFLEVSGPRIVNKLSNMLMNSSNRFGYTVLMRTSERGLVRHAKEILHSCRGDKNLTQKIILQENTQRLNSFEFSAYYGFGRVFEDLLIPPALKNDNNILKYFQKELLFKKREGLTVLHTLAHDKGVTFDKALTNFLEATKKTVWLKDVMLQTNRNGESILAVVVKEGYLDRYKIINEFLEDLGKLGLAKEIWLIEDLHSRNVLHTAVVCKNKHILKLVVEGANKLGILDTLLNSKDNDGLTPIELLNKMELSKDFQDLLNQEKQKIKNVPNKFNLTQDSNNIIYLEKSNMKIDNNEVLKQLELIKNEMKSLKEENSSLKNKVNELVKVNESLRNEVKGNKDSIEINSKKITKNTELSLSNSSSKVKTLSNGSLIDVVNNAIDKSETNTVIKLLPQLKNNPKLLFLIPIAHEIKNINLSKNVILNIKQLFEASEKLQRNSAQVDDLKSVYNVIKKILNMWENNKLVNPSAVNELDQIAISTIDYLKSNYSLPKNIKEFYTKEDSLIRKNIFDKWKKGKLSNEQMSSISSFVSSSFWHSWIEPNEKSDKLLTILDSYKEKVLIDLLIKQDVPKEKRAQEYKNKILDKVAGKIVKLFNEDTLDKKLSLELSTNIELLMDSDDSDYTDELCKKAALNLLNNCKSSNLDKIEYISSLKKLFNQAVTEEGLENNGDLLAAVKKKACSQIVGDFLCDKQSIKINGRDKIAVLSKAKSVIYSLALDKFVNLKLVEKGTLLNKVLKGWKDKKFSNEDSNYLYQAFTEVWRDIFKKFECIIKPEIQINKNSKAIKELQLKLVTKGDKNNEKNNKKLESLNMYKNSTSYKKEELIDMQKETIRKHKNLLIKNKM